MAVLTLPDPPLSDGVITLRGLESADVPALVEICQDPEIPRWTLVPDDYTEQDGHDYLVLVAAGPADGTSISFAVTEADGGRILGTAGLVAIDRELGCGEIGYMLAAPARGRGAATRAVRLLAPWAFETLGLERLELHIDRNNAPSLAVAERAGFHPVAAPVMQRAETARFTADVFFARIHGG